MAELFSLGAISVSDVLYILEAVGVGIYSAVGIHFYSLLVSRTKNVLLVLLLFLACCGLFFIGGIAGVALIADSVQQSAPHAHHLRLFCFIAWIGTVWIYLILNRRRLMQRLKVKL